MTSRAKPRLAIVAPAVDAAVGAYIIHFAIVAREVFPPHTGILTGLAVIAAAAVAAWQLWRSARGTSAVLLVAGLCALTGLGALPEIFPIVHASSEPPSFLESHGYEMAIGVVVLTTIAAALYVHRASRAPDATSPS